MHDRLVEQLDLVDATLADAAGSIDPGQLVSAANVAARIRNRIDYPEDLSLVALAGGTGSGKSSLFNALLGIDAAEVGGMRPTTARALVSTPDERGVVLDGYIESLGDLARTTHAGMPELALIDLPDTDSVEIDHRLRVEALLPRLDAVVWVVDVEKYRDDLFHRGYIRKLLPYQSQFIFALNQVDRVPKAEVDGLAEDFAESLLEDGIEKPTVLAVAANPPLTPPVNIDALQLAMTKLAKGSVVEKLLVDLEQSVRFIAEATGGAGLDFERRWELERSQAAELAADGHLIAASRQLAAFFSHLAQEMSGPASEAALGLSAHIGEDLGSIVRSAEARLPEVAVPSRNRMRWRRRSEISDNGDLTPLREGHISTELDTLVDRSLRPQLRQRATVVSNLAVLAVSLAELRRSHGR